MAPIRPLIAPLALAVALPLLAGCDASSTAIQITAALREAIR